MSPPKSTDSHWVEALLRADDDALEARRESFRVWECPEYCVVMGRSGRAEAEVDLEACEAAGVPVVHRSSGGGTVLLGPGCLSVSLVLDLEKRPALTNVAASYPVILGWLRDALGIDGVTIAGTDLLLDGRKVSGNAQRRTPGWLLHHGTLLYGLDATLAARLLWEPARQPEHRRQRTHLEFLGRLPLDRATLVQRLEAARWL